MNTISLPTSVDDVTSHWLTRALEIRFPGVEVTNSEVIGVTNGTSTKIRVRSAYNSQGRKAGLPEVLLIKGGFEAHSAAMAAMYRREARFYSDVAPFIPMTAPQCYYAGSDPDSYQSIVIMEDLTLKGATMCHAQAPHTYEQAARRLDAMARYHAHTWNSAELNAGGRFDWVQGRFEGFGLVHNARYFQRDVWARMVQTPRGAATSIIFHDFDWVVGALEKLGELHRNSDTRCLLHGDAHPGNMYLEADGTPGFFDQQVIRGPWHYDVTKYVICSLDIPDRREWEKALIAYYLERLRSYGVEPPRFEHAWQCYRQEVVYSLAMFIINETAFQSEAVNTAYTARCNACAIDHDIKDLMRR